jgi:hypothetical protein
VNTRHRPFEDRWTPLAGQGTLGASYLPCCAARLVAGADWRETRSRLALLWSERAAALRFRRAVLATTPAGTSITGARLTLARLQREAFAYDAGAAHLRRIQHTRVGWLIGHLRTRRADPVVGATFETMSAELAVLAISMRLARADDPEGDLVAAGPA